MGEWGLTGRLIRYVYSREGPQADVAIIEPNGDQYEVRCLLRKDGTDIQGDRTTMAYLNARYGDRELCLTAQGVVMGID